MLKCVKANESQKAMAMAMVIIIINYSMRKSATLQAYQTTTMKSFMFIEM